MRRSAACVHSTTCEPGMRVRQGRCGTCAPRPTRGHPEEWRCRRHDEGSQGVWTLHACCGSVLRSPHSAMGSFVGLRPPQDDQGEGETAPRGRAVTLRSAGPKDPKALEGRYPVVWYGAGTPCRQPTVIPAPAGIRRPRWPRRGKATGPPRGRARRWDVRLPGQDRGQRVPAIIGGPDVRAVEGHAVRSVEAIGAAGERLHPAPV
jgi:hypothetical protein